MDYRVFNESLDLSGKTAIITGAASGIGLEIGKMFARKGARLVAFDLSEAEALAAYCRELGAPLTCVVGDLRSRADLRRLCAAALAAGGRIDVLVNCAGIGILEPALESSEEVWDKTLAINLSGLVWLSIEAARHMAESGGGSIINLASQAGVVAIEKHLAYGVAKAGIIQATKQFALEWGRLNIRTNAISPTVILTPMGEMNWNNAEGEAVKRQIPLRRFGYPQEVAACALFLASDAARLFNGANLVIDGGYTVV